MSHLNYVTIRKNNKENYGREYCQEGMRGVPTNTNRVSKKIRCWNISSFRMEKREDTKNGTTCLRTHVRKQRATREVKNCTRCFLYNSENKIKYPIFSIKKENVLYFFLFLEYNPIILKIKGLLEMQTSEKKHLTKLTMGSEIEHKIEYKLKGLYALLEALELTGDDVSPAVFSTLTQAVKNILDDIQPLKESVDYMFKCSVVEVE